MRAENEKRLLILDGHNSHCSLKFVLYAERNGIIVLCLPPHTTHRLQPCDVGVFGPLANVWSRVVKDAYKRGYKITKNNFLSFYSQTREESLTTSNITAAFKRCGIWPYNPDVITEEDLAPAENTSCLASQPIPPSLPPWLELIETSSATIPTNAIPPPPITPPYKLCSGTSPLDQRTMRRKGNSWCMPTLLRTN